MAEPRSNSARRLLVVLPHPDDETLGLNGTIPLLADRGVRVDLVTATLGEGGWTGPPADNPGPAAVARIREPELRCAAEALGVTGLHLLGCTDGEVDQADPREITAQIAAIIRAARPQVVVTYGPEGIYGHPDHIALSHFTAAAVHLAAARPDDQNPAHVVAKFYYAVDTVSLLAQLQETGGTVSMEVDGMVREHFGWPDWAITARLDTAAYYDTVWRAVQCHASQHPGFAPILDLPEPARRAVFRYATFVRVFSLVNGGSTVETDLFEGIE